MFCPVTSFPFRRDLYITISLYPGLLKKLKLAAWFMFIILSYLFAAIQSLKEYYKVITFYNFCRDGLYVKGISPPALFVPLLLLKQSTKQAVL